MSHTVIGMLRILKEGRPYWEFTIYCRIYGGYLEKFVAKKSGLHQTKKHTFYICRAYIHDMYKKQYIGQKRVVLNKIINFFLQNHYGSIDSLMNPNLLQTTWETLPDISRKIF